MGSILVPVAPVIMRKVSPQGIYYAGADKWHNSFTDDMGDLFEQCVGRQLKLIPDAAVYPEIIYGPQRKKTIDYAAAAIQYG